MKYTMLFQYNGYYVNAAGLDRAAVDRYSEAMRYEVPFKVPSTDESVPNDFFLINPNHVLYVQVTEQK